MDSILFWLVPVASVLALCFAYYFHKQMMKESEGTPQMIKIAAAVRKGAMSYLKQQYKIVGWVFLGLVILFSIMAYGFHVQSIRHTRGNISSRLWKELSTTVAD